MRKGREEKTKFNHYMISIGNKKGFADYPSPQACLIGLSLILGKIQVQKG
jgi:hypothetical protein